MFVISLLVCNFFILLTSVSSPCIGLKWFLHQAWLRRSTWSFQLTSKCYNVKYGLLCDVSHRFICILISSYTEEIKSNQKQYSTFILDFERVTPFLAKSRNPRQGKYWILKSLNIDIFEEYDGFQIITGNVVTKWNQFRCQ